MTRLGAMLRLYRASQGMSIREVATAIGTSPATLSRLERGHECDTPTWMRLWAWMSGEEPQP